MDTILIVEDEVSVRTTLSEWLAGSKLPVEVLVAGDAAAALQLAGRQAIDLAILDWNLGAGLNGLQLLEDLHEFQRELIAILVTGYAHKATPLDALRLGVRDYLDKNHDLTREKFLTSVKKQLERIQPLKRERLIHQQLDRFRAVVAEALPRLETASVLQQEGVHLEQIVGQFMQFALQLTGASSGLLVVRQFVAQHAEPEQLLVYDHTGQRMTTQPVAYSQSLAAAIASLAPAPLATSLAATRQLSNVALSPQEAKHQQLLGMALHVSPSLTVVLELFDRQSSGLFQKEDSERLTAWQPLASVLLKLLLGERASQKMLYDTLQAALQESEQFVGNLKASGTARVAASQVFTSQVKSAGQVSGGQVDQWAELLQRLTQQYGPAAVERVMKMLQQVEGLLHDVTQVPAN
ncbi:MAG TPA: response regulator [Gemmatales bacterium]|nr:response regulator [Gemmatales bacterium]